MRDRSLLQLALGLAASLLLVSPALAHDGSVIDEIELVPPSDEFPASMALIEEYARQPDWNTEVVVRDRGSQSAPVVVQLTIPDPFTAGGSSPDDSVLPTTPESSIYRFKYLPIASSTTPPLPFRYVEVDWNTEGQPRGPNGSFINPHYDFHFYVENQSVIDEEIDCVTVGKTCDSQLTGYEQMRRFLDLPKPRFVPSEYFPDIGSSIVAMGLHNLDGSFDYTVENVNHNPVIIYGTFDGELVFLEASLTLFAFQDAINLPAGQKLTWPVLQPETFAFPWWPTEMSLQYDHDRGNFIFALEGFDAIRRPAGGPLSWEGRS